MKLRFSSKASLILNSTGRIMVRHGKSAVLVGPDNDPTKANSYAARSYSNSKDAVIEINVNPAMAYQLGLKLNKNYLIKRVNQSKWYRMVPTKYLSAANAAKPSVAVY